MKLIIDISKENYKNIKEQVDKRDYPDMQIGRAIVNGTPLPKGHGRLIDADELRLDVIAHKYSNSFCVEHSIEQSINIGMLNILMADAPTIIEADEAESEDKE